MKRRRTISLRMRLALGAATLAVLAILAAFLLIYGITESARRVEEAVAAQRRMELLSILSARVGDYAMVAAETTRSGSRSREQKIALLESRQEIVDEAFNRLDRAFGESVLDAKDELETEQMRRATRGLGLARMKAQFERLTRTLSQQDGIDTSRFRVALDAFATQFSPLLDQAIAAERRDRDASFESAARFRRRLTWAAWGVVGTALLLLTLFQLGLVRPLMQRIGRLAHVAERIGTGEKAARLTVEQRDELGLLFANVNRMAARIDRHRAAVEADRRELNATISERTRELEAANSRLARADSQRRRFFADVSHELRTPLTVILGEADLGIRARNPDTAELQDSMALIHTRAKRLNRRIDDLLRVARSESGEIDLASEPFDLAVAVREAIEDIASLARRRHISIDAREAPSALALGDREWTRQVIAGLLDNAIRHSQEHTQIRVSIETGRDAIRATVSDEGYGIPSDEQERAFERFARGASQDERSGFGVGLALAKWIMERQSGSIALRSPPLDRPSGTEVTIELPPAGENRSDDA